MNFKQDSNGGYLNKTQVQQNTLQPSWNETFVFAPMKADAVARTKLTVELWDKDDGMTQDDRMGQVVVDLKTLQAQVLAADGSGAGAQVEEWYDVVDHQNRRANVVRQQKSVAAHETKNPVANETELVEHGGRAALQSAV